MRQNSTISFLKTLYRLGIINVARVAIYRLCLRTGYYRATIPNQAICEGWITRDIDSGSDSLSKTSISYFTKHTVPINSIPDWFSNPWRPSAKIPSDHWSQIPDFSESVGDIKTVWEASRFDWAPKFALQAKNEKDGTQSAIRLELWLRDWVARNPAYQGINWKCGQEASLRSLNLLLAAKILGECYAQPSMCILHFFEVHLRRIKPTILYAKAQDNNHGTSEAIALFCLGVFLFEHGSIKQKKFAAKSIKTGRRFLENRVAKLILVDGSFSQQSITYHRLMLDTMTLCELTRRQHGQPPFSSAFQSRMSAATLWLAAFVDKVSGDAPNLGANDGAYFGNVEELPYRDFRPSVNRAMAVFCNSTLNYPANDEILCAYSVDTSDLKHHEPESAYYFPDGGYARLDLHEGDAHVVFRFPKYSFRPSHCDGNHVDIWFRGKNITLDDGSYSYNHDTAEYKGRFGGTGSHCTMMFDNRDQMPKISRMLRGEWLHPDVMHFSQETREIESKYTDYLGAWHHRLLRINDNVIRIKDSCGGFDEVAQLTWRLPDSSWQRVGNIFEFSDFTIEIDTAVKHDVQITTEKMSLHYLEVEDVLVIKVLISEPGQIETRFSFK